MCIDWYCLAILWAGGIFEATSPYGIILAVGSFLLFIWMLIK